MSTDAGDIRPKADEVGNGDREIDIDIYPRGYIMCL